MDTAGTATATISPQGIVTGWSEGARRLLGYSAPEIVGHRAAELLATVGLSDATGYALAASREWSGTAALRHHDGHRLDLALHSIPSLDRDGETEAYLVTAATDVSPPAYDREVDGGEVVEWAFSQSSIALSAFTKDSGGWRAAASAQCGEDYTNEGAEEDGGDEEDAGDEGDEAFLRHIDQVAEEAAPTRYERSTPARSALREHARVTEMWPVRDPATGRVCGVGTATFDSSEQHWARQRLALLNEAGTCIGTTLDVTRTAQELADLVVPRLADFISVDLLDSVTRGDEPVAGPVDADVELRRIAHASGSQDSPEAAVDLGEADTYPPYSPPARCLATGRAVLSGADDPDFVRWIGQSEARSASVRGHGFHSLMAVPLRARGITLGVAVFARGRCSERFEEDDLVLAEELAGRAAVGVDNARRYTRERSNALTLQRSLLPRDFPEQAAVEVAFRYLPAGSGAGVGGDWFDVVPLSGTRVALVVGDVVGHGLHASATMGRLRTAVRTLADVDLPPDELLTHLDDLVTHLSSDDDILSADLPDPGEFGEIGATCLYAVYDPVSRVCTLASAGHPPPAVLRPDGTVTLVELSPGPLLGVGGLPFESTEIELPEGSLLAFYTDGLIEARDHDIGAGIDRLCKSLASPVPSLDVTCDAILKALLPDTRDDDVALLLARTRALHADQVAAWALPSDPAIVAAARAQTSRQLATWGLEDAAFITELVVSELVTNAIRYGAVPIGLRLIRDRALICEVSDASNTAPHLRRARVFDEGGRGLHMVAQLTQGWGTRQTATGKTIWAEQPLPAS
ncbi:SpoIIE family protein phosphatase [Streptomyces sp. CA-288835]|uniref:ATP-binding SpoIIE family protein phosphatase n=1 Tax=Streptomyces sp. CA-288835 TaxID=3240069 RepID=UPI003D901707